MWFRDKTIDIDASKHGRAGIRIQFSKSKCLVKNC